MAYKPIEILMVEDNHADVVLTTEAFEDAKIGNRLRVVEDGVEAMDYLHRRGPYRGAARPDLILLDLNLPRKDGREVLKEIKADPSLAAIPVVVLTASSLDEDILNSYDHHANCYISKPVDLDGLLKVVGLIEEFWLTVVKLPERPDEGPGPKAT
jgi:CheY-like chemotaxis protein